MHPAVFLDRDGTISEEVGYVNHIDRFRLYPWSAGAIALLNRAGLKTILVTNQSGVARGYFPESLLASVHEKMVSELARDGARLDAIYYCPHHPDGCVPGFTMTCDCRKPANGMILRASRELSLDLRSSYVVGDRYNDLAAGISCGARTILVLSGYGRGEYQYQRETWPRQPEYIARDLLQAAEWIAGDAASDLDSGGQDKRLEVP